MLAIYYDGDQFNTGVETIRHAFTSVCPVTGLPDRDAIVIALGQCFNVWHGGLRDDPEHEAGYPQWPLPVPAIDAKPR